MEHITVTDRKIVRIEMRKARDVDGPLVLVRGTNVDAKKRLKQPPESTKRDRVGQPLN